MLRELDHTLFYFVNQKLAGDILDFIMPLFARHEDWFLVMGVTVLIMLYSNKRKGLSSLLLCGAALALNDSSIHFFLKPFWGRLRPCNELPPETFRLLVQCGESLSFPSQHGANMFVVASVIGWKYNKAAILLFSIASLVGFSRIYLGVHFPFDVIGGALFGMGWGIIALYAEHFFLKLKTKKMEQT